MKPRPTVLPALVAACLALATSSGQAAVLFDNGLTSGAQQRTANDGSQRLYEDFMLATPVTVTGFSWAQHDRLGQAYGHTTISLYAGLPEMGPALHSFDVTATRTANGSGIIFGVFDGYDYSVDGLSLALPAGSYYLSFIDSGSNRSGWDDTLGGADTIGSYRVINVNFAAPGLDRGKGFNLAFQVIGTPVPEPHAAALMLAGLGLLAAARIRRLRAR